MGISFVFLGLWGGVGGWQATAQEALGASLAGQMALDAKKQKIAAGWGDIRFGPVSVDLSAQLGIEGSDNVRYRETGKEADLILRPGIDVRALYPVTEKNALTFGTGIGYNFYVDNDDLNYLYITPDSDFSFDIYTGDFVISFHDRFHFTQDVTDQPSISGRGSYGRFDNSLGTLVLWDMNQAQLAFSYDHLIYFVTEDEYDYTDHTSELFGLRSAWHITPATPLGIEGGFGMTDYNKEVLNDLNHFSAGAFYEVPAGQLTKLRLAGGYVWYDPTTEHNTNALSGQTMDAVYADLSFHHRVTPHFRYLITAGQKMQAGLYAETLTLLYARASATLQMMHGYALSASFGYENGEESGRTDVEQFDRYLAGVSLEKRLSEKFSTSLAYTFIHRNSDLPDRGYTQNRLVLNLRYSF